MVIWRGRTGVSPSGGDGASSARSGFSLLELILVIVIVSILVGALTYPVLEKAKTQARETALVNTLRGMRQMINTYVADKRKLPESLDAMVEAGYFKQIPLDPITQTRTWTPEIGKLPGASNFGLSGITNIHSTSDQLATDGTPYNTW